MANAQNIDKIFAELAKKVKREVTIINDVEYANIHNEGGVVNPKVTDKMRKFAWYKVYSLAGIRKGSKKKGKTAKKIPLRFARKSFFLSLVM